MLAVNFSRKSRCEIQYNVQFVENTDIFVWMMTLISFAIYDFFLNKMTFSNLFNISRPFTADCGGILSSQNLYIKMALRGRRESAPALDNLCT